MTSGDTRPWIVWLGLFGIVGALAMTLLAVERSPNALPMQDFVEYWSAAKVTWQGGNPYDGRELLPYQRDALRNPELAEAMMMWNPPPALALVAPLAWLPANSAHLLFLALQLACLIVSAHWLWTVYRGSHDHRWVAWLIVLLYAPSGFIFWYGQIGGVLVLGVAGFLHFRTSDRPLLAGLFVALTAVKPHLLFAFGWVLLLDAIMTRAGRRVVLAGVLTVLTAATLVWLVNPGVYAGYSHASWQTDNNASTSPKSWAQPLVSYWLRVAIDRSQFAIQFIPTLLTTFAVTLYWFRNRRTWDWRAETPRLVLLSAFFAAYGAWIFDLVVLQVAIIPAAIIVMQRSRLTIMLFALAYATLTASVVCSPTIKAALTGSRVVGMHELIWFTPCVAVLCWLACRSESTVSSAWSELHAASVSRSAKASDTHGIEPALLLPSGS
jgi:hypothetical protein